MTNFEFYKEDILNIVKSNSTFGVKGDKPVDCRILRCDSTCIFKYPNKKCNKFRFRWMYSERFKKFTLNKYEHALCEALRTGWIIRDPNGELLLYDVRPLEGNLPILEKIGNYTAMRVPESLVGISRHNPRIEFKFITDSDLEPWSIEELLRLEVDNDD